MKVSARRLALTCSLIPFLTLATVASAQDAPADEAEAAEQEEIVVTGSLIRRPNNTAVRL
jgi:hypothetical protein